MENAPAEDQSVIDDLEASNLGLLPLFPGFDSDSEAPVLLLEGADACFDNELITDIFGLEDSYTPFGSLT